MTSWVQPLDLQTIFVNYLSGTWEIFSFIAILVIAALAATFRMPNQIYALILVLAGILLYGWIGGGFYIIIVLLVGIAVFWAISRIVK